MSKWQWQIDGPLAAGKRFRHWRGGTYTIVATAFEETTGHAVVVYRSEATGVAWTRHQGDFLGMVKQPDGPSVPRFVPVEETGVAR